MWMKGYIDRGGEFDMVDAFNSRKLRPLVPKPATSSSTSSNNMFPTINPPCFNRLHGSDNFFALNHHFHHLGEESRRELNTQPVVVSSRWNPTPEQLRTLEELYRRGTRTPSADQIQHITAQLRRFGKIEGKNVFYWFQNHKARERQKRRRQLESGNSDAETLEKKESVTGSSRTGFEGEQNKNWALPTNCSILAEEPVAVTQRAAKAVALERRTDEWLQFQSTEGILGNTRSLEERNATWKTRELSSSLTAYNLINTIAATIPTTATTETAPPAIRSVDPKLIKSTQDFSCIHRERHNEEEGQKESQTLQLFPLRCHDENGTEKETGLSIASIDLNTPQQFFEFLPLKN